MVKDVLRHLENHPDSPNRNKIGITFDDHKKAILDLLDRGKYVYKVIEYKDTAMVTRIFSLGITAGKVTGYKYYLVNVNNEQLEPITY
jgi:hypothetical protein